MIEAITALAEVKSGNEVISKNQIPRVNAVEALGTFLILIVAL